MAKWQVRKHSGRRETSYVIWKSSRARENQKPPGIVIEEFNQRKDARAALRAASRVVKNEVLHSDVLYIQEPDEEKAEHAIRQHLVNVYPRGG